MKKNTPPPPGSDSYVSLYLDKSNAPEGSKDVLSSEELYKLDTVLQMCGVYDIFSKVSEKWNPYLEKLNFPEDEALHEAADTLALFYIGKKMESFNFNAVDLEDNRLQKTDMTNWIIEDALNQLSAGLGDKLAKQIYKRLQTITIAILKDDE